MDKIPIGATVARAYRFAFGDFFKILGVIWLTFAIMSAFNLVLSSHLLALQAALTETPAAIGPMLPYLIPLYIVIFILIFMQVIGIAQLALGTRAGPSWFYFSLGKPLWRLIGSILLLLMALIIGYVLLILGTLLVAFLAGFLAKLVPATAIIFGLLAAVAAAVLWCGYIYAVVRLTFLLIPVIAAGEEGFALERAWSLGKGNFWRMFVITLAVLLPFIALEFAVLVAFVWHGEFPLPPPDATPVQAAAFHAAMQARNMAVMEDMYRYWYISFPAFAVFTVLFFGVHVGAQVFAYRALNEDTTATPSLP